MLYLVPTPIGHLQDITLRALDLLKTADYILAEDTRQTARLLKHFEIQTPLRSHHSHNEHRALTGILEDLRANKTLVLVSDAGTPGISDPGFLLVRACVEAGLEVQCLPGATAFVPALVVSGLPCDSFHFEGFLPHKKGRQTRWAYLSELPNSFILYESPFRILKCLEEVKQYCGPDRRVCLSRELSKIFEEHRRGSAEEVLAHYQANPQTLKGEMVLVVAGKAKEKQKKQNAKYQEETEEED